MKKINNKFLLIFSIVATLFISCGEQENILFGTSNGFIQFSGTTATVVENSTDPVVLNVIFGGDASQNTSGITVNFEVTSSDAARYSVVPANGTLEIPAGQVSAEITLTPLDNLQVDGNVDITVALSNSSSVPVGLGGQGLNFNMVAVTLVDDDCPISINDWVGTYSVDENFTAGRNSPSGLSDFFGEAYQFDLALDPTDTVGNKLIMTNSSGFNTYIADGTVLAFDTCNGKVSFDGANEVEVALFRNFQYTDSTYDETAFIIKATGPLATFGEYQFTLTKQ